MQLLSKSRQHHVLLHVCSDLLCSVQADYSCSCHSHVLARQANRVTELATLAPLAPVLLLIWQWEQSKSAEKTKSGEIVGTKDSEERNFKLRFNCRMPASLYSLCCINFTPVVAWRSAVPRLLLPLFGNELSIALLHKYCNHFTSVSPRILYGICRLHLFYLFTTNNRNSASWIVLGINIKYSVLSTVRDFIVDMCLMLQWKFEKIENGTLRIFRNGRTMKMAIWAFFSFSCVSL